VEEAAARRIHVKQRYFGGCPNWQTTYEQLRQVLNDQGLNDGAFAEWPPDRRRGQTSGGGCRPNDVRLLPQIVGVESPSSTRRDGDPAPLLRDY